VVFRTTGEGAILSAGHLKGLNRLLRLGVPQLTGHTCAALSPESQETYHRAALQGWEKQLVTLAPAVTPKARAYTQTLETTASSSDIPVSSEAMEGDAVGLGRRHRPQSTDAR
jgi:hypothetical protein